MRVFHNYSPCLEHGSGISPRFIAAGGRVGPSELHAGKNGRKVLGIISSRYYVTEKV
jgi:hypothetical protein